MQKQTVRFSVVTIVTFRGIPISDYFKFQAADISIRYRLLQTYNKTHNIVTFSKN